MEHFLGNLLHRRNFSRSWVAGIFAVALVVAAPALAADTAVPPEAADLPDAEVAMADSLQWSPPSKHFGRAALEVLGINAIVWGYDRFIREGGDNPEFRVGTNSIWENIKNRMEWDNNSFGTNNFAHPYHGSLYYSAARANGYSYWESIPFVFAGSYLWEFTGEANNPAYNDWINTSVGGIAFGESLYRLSNLVLDDTATGSRRFWRELGGLFICPVRGFNRIISGEWSRVGPNPPDRRPNRLGFRLESGIRSQSREKFGSQDTSGVFISFDFLYGDPFAEEKIKPFDDFTFNLQLNFNDVSTIGRLQIAGMLFGDTVHKSESTQHILGAYQYFEFIDNRAYEFGGQSAGASWLSRYGAEGANFVCETELGLGVVLLAGTSSEVANFSGRDYDYGSGLSYRAGARLLRRDRIIAEFQSEGCWLYTLNGVDGHYIINITHLQGAIPLYRDFGVGAELRGYYRKAYYDEFEDVSRWYPEARVFLTLATN